MRIKAGVLGLGFMGSAHAKVYSQLKGSELVGVCDIDLQKEYLVETFAPIGVHYGWQHDSV